MIYHHFCKVHVIIILSYLYEVTYGYPAGRSTLEVYPNLIHQNAINLYYYFNIIGITVNPKAWYFLQGLKLLGLF